LPDGSIELIETEADAMNYQPDTSNELAWITQTTLSLDDTAEIVSILQKRFPEIHGPHKEDICYATTNRQHAVKPVAKDVDAMIVVGAPNSSNSQRLREVAERAGCKKSYLVQRATELNWDTLSDIKTLGITAGASAPEVLVEEVLDAFSERYTLEIEVIDTIKEDVVFNLPRELRIEAAS
ncbi:MAG: 4-hydroxy-3-methylbut-2-enyl diphosphate reductase, partial [Hyphomicrobiales bacterium]